VLSSRSPIESRDAPERCVAADKFDDAPQRQRSIE
jgi:hypothetical protein